MASCVIVQDVGLLRVRSTWKISIASERDQAEGEALARDFEMRARRQCHMVQRVYPFRLVRRGNVILCRQQNDTVTSNRRRAAKEHSRMHSGL
jgi:hypothetical protein